MNRNPTKYEIIFAITALLAMAALVWFTMCGGRFAGRNLEENADGIRYTETVCRTNDLHADVVTAYRGLEPIGVSYLQTIYNGDPSLLSVYDSTRVMMEERYGAGEPFDPDTLAESALIPNVRVHTGTDYVNTLAWSLPSGRRAVLCCGIRQERFDCVVLSFLIEKTI